MHGEAPGNSTGEAPDETRSEEHRARGGDHPDGRAGRPQAARPGPRWRPGHARGRGPDDRVHGALLTGPRPAAGDHRQRRVRRRAARGAAGAALDAAVRAQRTVRHRHRCAVRLARRARWRRRGGAGAGLLPARAALQPRLRRADDLHVAIRWPLVGFIVGSVAGDPTAWHADRHVVHLCSRLTWLLALPCLARVVVQAPIYLAGRNGWWSTDSASLPSAWRSWPWAGRSRSRPWRRWCGC